MTDEELSALLADSESDRVERKQEPGDREKIRKAICAFANDLPGHGKPGVIFVGVRDDGSCAGLVIDDALLTSLSNLRGEGLITPLPSMRVQKRTLGGCELAVVEVDPVVAPPVRYRGMIWVRHGPATVQASDMDEQRLRDRRRSADLPFDLRPVHGARIEDLDLEWFRRNYLPAAVAPEILERNNRSQEEQLASLRFVASTADPVPTVAGLLIAGLDPRAWLPGAYVQFLRFAGNQLDAPVVDQAEFGGPLPQLIPQLEDKLKAHVHVAVRIIGSPIETRHPDYPLDALVQLVRNAVMHRTYEGTNSPVRVMWFEDRIEILSPGGPFGLVNKANFGQPGLVDYRNPGLAEALKALGFVQRFGVGIALARRLLAENGNPELELQPEDTAVLAVVRRAQ